LPEPSRHVDLGGYALGLLDPDDRSTFERHLAGCESCRHELDELTDAALLLHVATTEDAPPIGLRTQVLLAVERAAGAPETAPAAPRRRRPRLALVAAAGAVTAVAALLLLAVRADGPAGPVELRAALISPSGEQATVEVRKTGIGRVIRFRTEDLPILPQGAYYELWFLSPGDAPGTPNRISAGTFHPDAHGRSHVTFAAAVDPSLYPVLSVTAEPGDGDPSATGPEVLRSRR
jgi:anti-sigma-K factor RskA